MQRGTGSSYLPTGNYINGGNLVQANLGLINVTISPGSYVLYIQGSEQRASRGTGSSYLPTGNYIGGGNLVQPNLGLINVTISPGSYVLYIQGSEQRASLPINLSLPLIFNLNFGNGAGGPSAVIPRNYFSFWIPSAILANALASIPMHVSLSFLPLPHSTWMWSYHSIQVPSMNETIGNELMLHQGSLPLVPTHQFTRISNVPGPGRVIAQNFLVIRPPRFGSDHLWRLPFAREVNHLHAVTPLHPNNFYMVPNGGQIGATQTFYIDLDNMIHEVLSALQNLVGHVSTGLTQEVILAHMTCIKYQLTERATADNDWCCICMDDFCDGEMIGNADCGHSFHFDCITEWLMQKNSCPLCKRTALTICSN